LQEKSEKSGKHNHVSCITDRKQITDIIFL